MINILEMGREELLSLNPDEVNRMLTKEEVLYIWTELDGFWAYDYDAAKDGKTGLHARLKSERCSDGFLYSKIVLEHDNIRAIMARQLVFRFNKAGIPKPDLVAGIPDGATKLGQDFGSIMDIKIFDLKKENGVIKVDDLQPNKGTLLPIEDFCTKGTGFKEAVKVIKSESPDIDILPCELVIINRGGLKEILVDNLGSFKVMAITEHRINDWDPSECPLCEQGSKLIKPKATPENWQLIKHSQD